MNAGHHQPGPATMEILSRFAECGMVLSLSLYFVKFLTTKVAQLFCVLAIMNFDLPSMYLKNTVKISHTTSTKVIEIP